MTRQQHDVDVDNGFLLKHVEILSILFDFAFKRVSRRRRKRVFQMTCFELHIEKAARFSGFLTMTFQRPLFKLHSSSPSFDLNWFSLSKNLKISEESPSPQLQFVAKEHDKRKVIKHLTESHRRFVESSDWSRMRTRAINLRRRGKKNATRKWRRRDHIFHVKRARSDAYIYFPQPPWWWVWVKDKYFVSGEKWWCEVNNVVPSRPEICWRGGKVSKWM